MSCVGPKGVASLHELLSEPSGPTESTDIEQLSDQIDVAQAKFEAAALTDSIAKGDKVYVGAAIQALRFAHPALAATASQRDADERQDDSDDSDDESTSPTRADLTTTPMTEVEDFYQGATVSHERGITSV